MATYYPSLSNRKDNLPALYLPNQKPATDHESFCLPGNKTDQHLTSTPSSHEFVFSALAGDPESMQPIPGQLNITTVVSVDNCVTGDYQLVSRTPISMLHCEQNMPFHELSLGLGTQITSAVHVPSIQDGFTSPGLSSLYSSRVIDTKKGCFDSRGTEIATKFWALSDPRCSISTKEMHLGNQCARSGVPHVVLNSKYLKDAQELLDEVLNLRNALKQPESDKHHNFPKLGLNDYKETNDRSNCRSAVSSVNAILSDPKESITNSCNEFSAVEQQDLLSKMTELLSMLNEVDRRYKQYRHQMQIVISSFEMVAGFGAAKPYTVLALQTISHQFRCIHDAIYQQIRVTKRRLGEADAKSNSQGGGLSQLWYVNQNLREHRVLHQVGLMRNSWRSQRGLPESSVSILRAWLFEHFLHPYPKDSEKIILAKRTGLTRNQVANWFINARVRLWKPMIEDIYKEEFGYSEADTRSSLEQVAKAKDESWAAAEDREQELKVKATSAATDDSKSDLIIDVGINACVSRMVSENDAPIDDNSDCEVVKLHCDQRHNNMADYSEGIIPTNQNGDGSLMSPAIIWWDSITKG